MNEDGEWVAEY